MDVFFKRSVNSESKKNLQNPMAKRMNGVLSHDDTLTQCQKFPFEITFKILHIWYYAIHVPNLHLHNLSV